MKRYGRHRDWQTILSSYHRADFVKLVDEDSLTLVLDMEGSHNCHHVIWHEFGAYKNTLEEHGLPWTHSDLDLRTAGCTHMVEESPWLDDLRSSSGLFDILIPKAKHFVIITSLYVTEIISSSEPEILKLNHQDGPVP